MKKAKQIANKNLPYEINDPITSWSKERIVSVSNLKIEEETKEEYYVKINIGSICPIGIDNENNGYYINKINNYDMCSYPRIKYPDANSAASGLYALWFHLNELREQNTTNDDVLAYLNSQITDLISEERNLRDINYSFKRKIEQLRYFSELFNIKKSVSDISILYPKDYIQSLIDFKLDSGENFFSESCLYELIGKEKGRSVLTLINNIIKQIDITRSLY